MTGMYYTPKEIQKICDPSTGTGAFLKHAADGLSNPPYAFNWFAVGVAG
jgi:type I restriction-modification system DNA methylase subunit